VIFDPTVKLDGEPWTCAPVHLFGEVEKLVVQTRAHGKILVIFDKNRVLLAKNRRATNNEYGANLQHVKRGAQEGGRRRVFIPP
jgi:hypothetical protein